MGNTILSLQSFLSTCILVLVLIVPVVHAEQVEGLYRVSVPVSSQSARELSRASKAGLSTVFVRVSGNADVIGNRTIAEAINRPKNYTRQFRYGSSRDAEDGSEQLFVVLEFEPKLVDERLREAGLPLWSSNRPTVLVWMVIEDRQGRRFASAERDADIITAITDNARRRGLALKLPMLDLEDMVAVSPDDMWQLNSRKALTASERYQADSVLFGRATLLTNGRWLGSWQYLLNGQRVVFDGDADTIERYVGGSIDQVAELLAAEYAIVPVKIAEDGVLMRLSGVGNFVDYARAIAYLESLSAIRHANVVHIEGDDIIVRLVADGLLPQLQQAFALDNRLLPASGFYQGTYPIMLDYQWPASSGTQVPGANPKG